MRLSPEDAQEYFRLMWGLLFFINQHTRQVKNVNSLEEFGRLGGEVKLNARQYFVEHPEIIDSYVKQNPHQLNQEELQIVGSWKNYVAGSFFIERFLKKHAIFIQDNRVYGVIALQDTLEEVLYMQPLPVYVIACLLPFKGQIIYDGLLQTHQIYFGSGIRGDLKEKYLAAKQQQRIITALEADGQPQSESEPTLLPDLTPEIEELQKLAAKLRASKGTPALWSPTFTLVRAALDMAHLAVQNPDQSDPIWDASDKVEKALGRIYTVLRRSEM
ncbi:MAG: hypothetical protein KF893_26050 [Caldilineaceae bacterium]|nr:hypothetical protein [Caldilineaceae bacterium]